MPDRFDALVIGGGPGGSTVALLLARAGWSVALVERHRFPRRKVCGEYVSGTNLPLLNLLGLSEPFGDTGGPEVRRVGLFSGAAMLSALLPRPAGRTAGWGRAQGREHLDTLLLERAHAAGVEILQPWSATGLVTEGDDFHCQVESRSSGRQNRLIGRVVVAAHGSWDPGPLPTHLPRRPPRPSDLLGFKAHFQGSQLPPDLMPLLVFPGGYGGMVQTDHGRVNLSCCIRRDLLALVRRRAPGMDAGDAVLAHIQESCLGVRRALAGACRQGPWLSAGPIRPGIRPAGPPGIFPVGNCAGEAHPAIAEGISMAMQSGWLLARHLLRWRKDGGQPASLGAVGKAYARSWRNAFAPRLYTAAAVAHWAMQPIAVGGTLPVLQCFPGLLSWAARLSGKATRVVRTDF
jgi:flavin-dependent dehydrogenase